MTLQLEQNQLSLQESELAAHLWDVLMFASSPTEKEAARRELEEATPHIQQAIFDQITSVIRENKNLQRHENPFDLTF